jgi:hypothetical protein
MRKASTIVAPTAANEPSRTSDQPAKPRRARRTARQPGTKSSAGEHASETAATPPSRGPSKIASVVALLKRAEGATLAELVAATGWLPHTTRATLTGLRKKGHILAKDRRDEVTCYRIAEAGE